MKLFHDIFERIRIKALSFIPGLGYRPYIPYRLDKTKLLCEIGFVFSLDHKYIEKLWNHYEAFYEAKGYRDQFGENKTLSFEEAFLFYVILSLFKPKRIVEIGTQYGRSTRKILDMKCLLGLVGQVTCFDITDEVSEFTKDEATLVVKDVTGRFRKEVMDVYCPDLIFLDARPRALIMDVVREVLKNIDCVLIIHDCSKNLCNPVMSVTENSPYITTETGVWERHVLAELFNIPNATSSQLDDIKTSVHRLKIFSTLHGLGVILPKAILHSYR